MPRKDRHPRVWIVASTTPRADDAQGHKDCRAPKLVHPKGCVMELLVHYELHRSLATIVQREELLKAQRRALVAAAERLRDGLPPAARRVVGTALVRVGERLMDAHGAERRALATLET